MPSCGLRAAKIFLGLTFSFFSLAQTLTIPCYAGAILSPYSFASIGTFGVNGVNQYDIGQTNNNPVITDSAGNVLYTGVFVGSFAQGTLEAVFDFTSFALGAGQTLTATSVPNKIDPLYSSPIVLLSYTSMTIAGTITANGSDGAVGDVGTGGNAPPAGSGAGGTGYAGGGSGGSIVNGASGMGGGPSGGGIGQAVNPATGGGGGGFGGAGGNGAPSGDKAGGTGGAAVATSLADKLQGGSGGGAGGGGGGGMINPAYSSGGGAGGGGIELSACCSINITGTINVNGGAGAAGYLGAGGGGSGGGILIAANTVTIGNTGSLLAQGGGGGATGNFGTAGGGGAGGEVYIETTLGGYTNNGMISVSPGNAGIAEAVAGTMGTINTDTNFVPCPEPGFFLLTGLVLVSLVFAKRTQDAACHLA